jgi:hypothetical protein
MAVFKDFLQLMLGSKRSSFFKIKKMLQQKGVKIVFKEAQLLKTGLHQVR